MNDLKNCGLDKELSEEWEKGSIFIHDFLEKENDSGNVLDIGSGYEHGVDFSEGKQFTNAERWIVNIKIPVELTEDEGFRKDLIDLCGKYNLTYKMQSVSR